MKPLHTPNYAQIQGYAIPADHDKDQHMLSHGFYLVGHLGSSKIWVHTEKVLTVRVWYTQLEQMQETFGIFLKESIEMGWTPGIFVYSHGNQQAANAFEVWLTAWGLPYRRLFKGSCTETIEVLV